MFFIFRHYCQKNYRKSMDIKLLIYTTIDSIVKTKIVQIKILLFIEPFDFNIVTFNEKIGYHIISEYDPLANILGSFQVKFMKKWYCGFKVDRFRLQIGLEEALEFQHAYT